MEICPEICKTKSKEIRQNIRRNEKLMNVTRCPTRDNFGSDALSSEKYFYPNMLVSSLFTGKYSIFQMVLLASHRFPDGETSLLDKKARLVIFKRLNNALSKIYFNSHLSFIPYLCSGVCFSLSFMCKSAPFLQSILTISMSPFMAAICNGVISVVLCAFTWAPCFRQSSIDGTLPVSTAK